jgi:serine/threonine-protein phosphatase Stp1
MNSQLPNFTSTSASHVGMVRKLNEDSLICRDRLGLWAVADGMGGHQAGDLASQNITSALGNVSDNKDIAELLRATRRAINEANSHLISLSDQYDSARRPGSTVAALLISGVEAAVVWAGDSRIYRLRNSELDQITRDHSHVQELVDQHLIGPEEAESHPMANVITRAVGIEEPLDLDVLHFDVVSGDRFLLCSDGLSRLLALEEIKGLMKTQELEESVQSMLHMALLRGAPDNVTLISVQCPSADSQYNDVSGMQPAN